MHYVYILQSEADERRFYTGLTDDCVSVLRLITPAEFPIRLNGDHGA